MYQALSLARSELASADRKQRVATPAQSVTATSSALQHDAEHARREADKLQIAVDELRDEIAVLKPQNRSLLVDLAGAHALGQTQADELQRVQDVHRESLEEALSKERTLNETKVQAIAESNAQQRRRELADVATRLEVVTSERDKLAAKLAAVENEHQSALQIATAERNSAIADLSTEVEKHRTTRDNVARIAGERQSTQERLDALMATRTHEIASANADVDRLRADHDIALQRVRDEATRERDAIERAHRRALDDALDRTRAQHDASGDALLTQVRQLGESNERLQSVVTERDKRIAQLEAQLLDVSADMYKSVDSESSSSTSLAPNTTTTTRLTSSPTTSPSSRAAASALSPRRALLHRTLALVRLLCLCAFG
jgi:chromosome segregation ATPase